MWLFLTGHPGTVNVLEDNFVRRRRRFLLLLRWNWEGWSCQVLLCPGVGTSSVREEDSGAEINKGPMTRPSALAMVGGRCQDGHHHEGVVDELFSSEVNLRNAMEVGWRRVVL